MENNSCKIHKQILKKGRKFLLKKTNLERSKKIYVKMETKVLKNGEQFLKSGKKFLKNDFFKS